MATDSVQILARICPSDGKHSRFRATPHRFGL